MNINFSVKNPLAIKCNASSFLDIGSTSCELIYFNGTGNNHSGKAEHRHRFFIANLKAGANEICRGVGKVENYRRIFVVNINIYLS